MTALAAGSISDSSGYNSAPEQRADVHPRCRGADGARVLRGLPAAFRWNAALIALYTRLMARGKPHKSALIACARKLLIYANTVVQRGTPWTEKPAML